MSYPEIGSRWREKTSGEECAVVHADALEVKARYETAGRPIRRYSLHSWQAGFDPVNAPRQVGDMKHGLTSSRPKLSILPRAGALHRTRALEYGADFYARGNYHGPTPIDPKTGERVPEALAILGYIDAGMRHLLKVADAVTKALGTGGDVGAAVGIVDDFAEGKPPSMLPDLAHAAASIDIAIVRAVAAGYIPEDPGQPWRAGKVTERPRRPKSRSGGGIGGRM